MTIKPEAQAHLDAQAKRWAAAGPNLTRAQSREIAAANDSAGEINPAAEVTHAYFASPTAYIPLVIFRPRGVTGKLPALLYFHGGGWSMNHVLGYAPQMSEIAVEAGIVVIGVNYQKSPEHQFPIPFDDCYSSVVWVIAHADSLGVDITKIGVGGDSAGGNLAACVALKARDTKLVDLAFQVLIYPTTSADMNKKSVKDHAEGFGLTAAALPAHWRNYCRAEDDHNPYALPTNATDFSHLAPAIIGVAEHDVLRDDGFDYAQLLEKNGNKVSFREFPGMIHGFFSHPKKLPDGVLLRSWISAQIKELCN